MKGRFRTDSNLLEDYEGDAEGLSTFHDIEREWTNSDLDAFLGGLELYSCTDGSEPEHLCLANCYEGRYYRQIAPRKADASPFLNGLGDSETNGSAKRSVTKSAHTA